MEEDGPKSSDGKLSSESSAVEVSGASFVLASVNDSPVCNVGVRGGKGVPNAGDDSGVSGCARLLRLDGVIGVAVASIASPEITGSTFGDITAPLSDASILLLITKDEINSIHALP